MIAFETPNLFMDLKLALEDLLIDPIGRALPKQNHASSSIQKSKSC